MTKVKTQLDDATAELLKKALVAIAAHTTKLRMIDPDGDEDHGDLERALRERAHEFFSGRFESGCDQTIIEASDLKNPMFSWRYVILDRALTNLGARGLNPGGDEGNDIPTYGVTATLLREAAMDECVIAITDHVSDAARIAVVTMLEALGLRGKWAVDILQGGTRHEPPTIRLRNISLPNLLHFEVTATVPLWFVRTTIVVRGGTTYVGKWFTESDVVDGIRELIDGKTEAARGHIDAAARLLEEVGELRIALRTVSAKD